MRLPLLLVGSSILVACGSSPTPVATPESIAVPPEECRSITLQSHWGGRAPTPATNVSASVADPALAKAVVDGDKVHVFATGTGATKVEIHYLDPVTKRDEQRTVAVDVRTAKGKDTPYPLEDKTHAYCAELRTRLGVAK